MDCDWVEHGGLWVKGWMTLNFAQERAVKHRGSGLLVLAGAGSGKTRVITTRIKSLVDEGVRESQILAVTFTNKAAVEMRGRLGKMGVSKDVWVGTFHATGVRILRRHGGLVGYRRDFTIYDSEAQKALIKALLADTDTGRLEVSEGYILQCIGNLKGEGKGPDDVGSEGGIAVVLRPIVAEVYRKYEVALRKTNAMDFADLILRTVEILRNAKGTEAEWLLRNFKHVLVDEFQDTNKLQMEMVDLLGGCGEICVVGDDDQSIYGWRGAYPDGMQEFADREGVELIKLEENYRCTEAILDCANSLIARNKKRLGKTLRANKRGDLVCVHRLGTERDEARQVALSISRPYGEHAILYRTHAQSRAIEEALRRAGVPYTIIGGLRFYDRAEIRDVFSFFRLAVNPQSDIDLLRVANKPSRGMGLKKMGGLKTRATGRGVSIYDELKESTDKKEIQLRGLLDRLGSLRHEATSLLDFFEQTMRITGYLAALENKARGSKSAVQREKAEAQVENVQELASDMASYDEEHPGAKIDDYLEHIALVSSFDKESGDSVPLMTIHAAKGLEFDHVHLVGFEEGLLPHSNALQEMKEKGGIKELEEERRLAYVAITRAKSKLDITMVKMRSRGGRTERAEPSRFFDELPSRSIRKLGF